MSEGREASCIKDTAKLDLLYWIYLRRVAMCPPIYSIYSYSKLRKEITS